MDSIKEFRAPDGVAGPFGAVRGVAGPSEGTAWARAFVALGSLLGLGAVAMAALAAHALPSRLGPAAMEAVRSAVQMQGWHALALLACGLWTARGGLLARAAGVAFLLGALLFCGAVYLWALAGIGGAGLAPVGGTVLMVGWVLLGLSAVRRPVVPS